MSWVWNHCLGHDEVTVDFTIQTNLVDYPDGEFYKIHKMATFRGPLSQKLNFDIGYIKVGRVNRESIEVISAYSNCAENDHYFQCQEENQIYGEDFQCISSLFSRKGRTEQCKGKYWDHTGLELGRHPVEYTKMISKWSCPLWNVW